MISLPGMYMKPNPRPVITLYVTRSLVTESVYEAAMRPTLARREPMIQTGLAPHLVTRLATRGPDDRYTAT